jgi:hypothetical protein
MTAIVDKKALETLLSLKAIARSRCQAQTAVTVWSIAARSRGIQKRKGWHSQTLREIPVPVRLCASFWTKVPQLQDRFGFSAASEGNDSMRNRLPVAPVIL